MLQKSTGNKILHNNKAKWFYCQCFQKSINKVGLHRSVIVNLNTVNVVF